MDAGGVTLRLLGNCSSLAAYEYTKQDVSKIFRAIKDAVSVARRHFEQKDLVCKPFSLEG